LYSSPNVIGVLKYRIIWAGHGVEKRYKQGFGGGNLTERDYLEYLGVDGRIILKWIFKKWDGRAWTGLVWMRIGAGGELLEVM